MGYLGECVIKSEKKLLKNDSVFFFLDILLGKYFFLPLSFLDTVKKRFCSLGNTLMVR